MEKWITCDAARGSALKRWVQSCNSEEMRIKTAAARCSTTSPHQVCCCGDGRMKAGGLVVLLGLCCHGVSSVVHSLKYFETASSGVSNFPEFVGVGMVDELQFIHYDSNSQKAELKQSWMHRLTRDDPQYLERETGKYLFGQQTFKADIENLKQRFNQTGGVHMVQRMQGCEWDDEDDTTDGYHQYGYDGEDFLVLDLKNLRWIAPTPQAVFTKLKWDQNRARLQYSKNYYNKECVDWLKKYLDYGKSTLQRTERPEVSLLQRRPSSPVVCHATGFYPDRVVVFWRRGGVHHPSVIHLKLRGEHTGPRWWTTLDCGMKAGGLVVLLGLCCHGVSSVVHSLKYFHTGSSGVSNFPEYVAVGMVDELQFIHYDSNSQKAELKQSWMDRLTRDDPQYLERETGIYLDGQQTFKVNIEILKQRFNQTGGVHMVQYMYGCEWDDEDDTTDGYHQYGYDGEDFLVLDLKNLRWIALTPQAFISKLRWDQDRADLEYAKNYYNKECVDWLKKHLDYGKSTLQRTERPEVSLLQRSPSSPVVCHATGFYPDRVVVFWRRDGEELYEHVDHGEVLPNPDGTFQVSVDLDLASVPREDWRRYECVVQLKGIKDISTRLDPALVRTNWGKTGPGGDGGVQNDITTPIIIAVLILAAVAAAGVAGVFVYKKRSGSHSSSGNSEEQSPAPEAQPLNTLSVFCDITMF
ncbi:Major histocompatibility complex class I-related gene protein [Merluccius polli]|uniref:Major histocompatibility complex class I-related gene protein n=1 Tax=Merluccius polli TaxID=89951 RepID=A0AA47PCM5_MERPO|nr:Major histocompatibility complex class I-related gene protein [Merluccius polli]